jgi:hypothetical protein
MGSEPNTRESWCRTPLAYVIYQSIAIVWFGMPVFADFTHSHIGQPGAPDPGAHAWFLAWWPYAISHHLNPFITRLVWAPSGYNLTWATSIPLPALLAAPITQEWGPVASLNLLTLLAPALAAWCAFVLYRRVCGSLLPSLIGGYIFGFSPYMLDHLMGHLCLLLVFPLPLAIYLVILRMERGITRTRFVALLTAAAVVLFLCSEEIFATAVVFGALALLTGLLLAQSSDRTKLVEICALSGVTLGIAAALLSPFLFFAFAGRFPHGPLYPPENYTSDLLGFIVPSPVLLIGHSRAIAALGHRIASRWAEDSAYIGLPLLAIIIGYGMAKWRSTQGKLILIMLALTVIASCGSRLSIRDTPTIPLPWIIAGELPLLDKALPGRIMVFAFLDAGLIVALYLSAPPRRTWKWMLAALAAVSLIPNLPSGWWFSKNETPRFFADGTFRKSLAKGETTLILPYGRIDNSMLWQALSGMYFRMAGGYTGITPPEFERWPAVESFYDGVCGRDFPRQLEFFLAAHDVRTIILAREARQKWAPMLAGLNLPAEAVKDVTLYKVPSRLLATYAGVTAEDAENAAAMDAFAEMISAADRYWTRGLPLSKLTPWEAARQGLLPVTTAGVRFDPDNPQWWRTWWMGQYGGPFVGIGIMGDYRGLSGVIRRYGPAAREVFFPYPSKLDGSPGTNPSGQLLMTFDRKALERAVAIAAPHSPPPGANSGM